MIFGSTRDSKVLQHIGREFVGQIVEQEILFYKVSLQDTSENIYGEAESRGFYRPVRLTCLIQRGDPTWTGQDYGPDYSRVTSFCFFKADFVDVGFKPEVGDIVEWDKNYYEIDSTVENQYHIGRDPWYRVDDGTNDTIDRTGKFGYSVSIICGTHLTRYTRLNLVDRN